MTEINICPITMEPIKKAKALNCMHVFETDAIESWLREHNTCPICRSPVEQPNENANSIAEGYGRSGRSGRSERRPAERNERTNHSFYGAEHGAICDYTSQLNQRCGFTAFSPSFVCGLVGSNFDMVNFVRRFNGFYNDCNNDDFFDERNKDIILERLKKLFRVNASMTPCNEIQKLFKIRLSYAIKYFVKEIINFDI